MGRARLAFGPLHEGGVLSSISKPVACAIALLAAVAVAAPVEAGPKTKASQQSHVKNSKQKNELASAKRARKAGKSFSGIASYYWQPQPVASGGRFNPHGMTAAHRTLPFGTRLRVTEPRSGRAVVVTVNDRGPFIRGRVLDLSLGAARRLGITARGVATISATIL